MRTFFVLALALGSAASACTSAPDHAATGDDADLTQTGGLSTISGGDALGGGEVDWTVWSDGQCHLLRRSDGTPRSETPVGETPAPRSSAIGCIHHCCACPPETAGGSYVASGNFNGKCVDGATACALALKASKRGIFSETRSQLCAR